MFEVTACVWRMKLFLNLETYVECRIRRQMRPPGLPSRSGHETAIALSPNTHIEQQTRLHARY